MLEECPHCFSRIVPMGDGTCPRCQKDTKDTSGVDGGLRPVTVTRRMTFPNACVVCGANTTRKRRVSESIGSNVNVTGLGLLSLFIGVYAALLQRYVFKNDQKFTESVRVPVCDACHSASKVRVLGTDYKKHEMTILVHERCRKQMDTARR